MAGFQEGEMFVEQILQCVRPYLWRVILIVTLISFQKKSKLKKIYEPLRS